MSKISFSRNPFVSLSALVMLAIGICWSAHAWAQVSGATLTGTVRDQTGAVIVGAQVSVHDVATGITRTGATDSAGIYSVPNLRPGTYDVKVSAPGFSAAVKGGIVLTVGAQQEFDFNLRVGTETQSMEVGGEVPTVNEISSTLATDISGTTVRELPLNGRSWTDLAALQPGVNQPNTQLPFTGGGRGQRGFGTQVTISGNRPDQNAYRLDGFNVNDYANGSPAGVLGGSLGVDATQEFEVLTGSFPAQYGRATGGIFNAITRTGTNALHGSAYEFVRNSALDSRNYFDGPTIPPFSRNQFGGSLGGPIRKDRTFFFADYEGLRQNLGVTQVGTTISPDVRTGLVHNANGSTTQVTVDPNIARFIQANLFPVMNGTLAASGNTGIFTNVIQQTTTENFVTGKVDHNFSTKDSLSGTYLFDKSTLAVPDLQDTKILGTGTEHQLVGLEESHIFSSQIVNSLRVGLNRSFADIQSTPTAINPAAGDHSFGAVPSLYVPYVGIPGVSAFTGGLGGPPHYQFTLNNYQEADDVFIERGIHSIKSGFSFERLQDNDYDIPSSDGQFTFKTITNFLLNKPSKFAGLIPGILSERGIRESMLGAYVQDDIKLKPNLSVNIGIRYEFATVPTEVHNHLSNFLNITDPAPHIGSPLYSNFTDRNFEPRVGFSWDPFRNGKTALRGGFGMYDVEPLPYEFFLATAQAAPFLERAATSKLPTGSFPAGGIALLAGTPSSFTYAWIQSNPRRRYVNQWNLSIERELFQKTMMTLAYVGSSGVHLPLHMDDSNMVIPTLTSAGYLWPNPIGSGSKINPNVGTMVTELMISHSSYNGAQLQIARTTTRFQLQGSYTWSRSIDNASGTFAGDAYTNGIATLDWYALNIDRGPSDFNITQNLVINGLWNVPSISSKSEIAWLSKGWELGGIFKVNTGIPLSATFGAGTDVLGQNNSSPYDYPDVLRNSGCKQLSNPGNVKQYVKSTCFFVPTAPSAAFYASNCDPNAGVYPQCFNLRGNAGRNLITGPGLQNLDVSVFKNNPIKKISEAFNVQLRAEIFNILNHPNFSIPANFDIFDATGAPIPNGSIITSTATPSRQIQFAVKAIW